MIEYLQLSEYKSQDILFHFLKLFKQTIYITFFCPLSDMLQVVNYSNSNNKNNSNNNNIDFHININNCMGRYTQI